MDGQTSEQMDGQTSEPIDGQTCRQITGPCERVKYVILSSFRRFPSFVFSLAGNLGKIEKRINGSYSYLTYTCSS